MDQHRIAIEPRSGIWLMFYETLTSFKGFYKQQLLRIFKDFDAAEVGAVQEKIDRKLYNPTIIRDAGKKDVTIRTGGE